MRSDLLRRVERLEDRLGTATCICSGGPGPGLVIVTGDRPDPEPLPVCPQHGEQPRLVVRVARYSEPPQQQSNAEQFARRLPSGRVEVLLPEPDPDYQPAAIERHSNED